MTAHASKSPAPPQPYRSLHPAVSTALSSDIDILHLVAAKPAVLGDIIDVHRMMALEKVRAALQQHQPTVRADGVAWESTLETERSVPRTSAESVGDASVLPSLQAMQLLPRSFLHELVYDCQLELPAGGRNLEDASAAELAATLHNHLTGVVQEGAACEVKKRANPAIWSSHGQQLQRPLLDNGESHPTTNSDSNNDGFSESSMPDVLSSSPTPHSRSWGSWGVIQPSLDVWQSSDSVSSSSSSSSSPYVVPLQEPTINRLWPTPAVQTDPSDPYAPILGDQHARQTLFQDLSTLLQRQGRKDHSPFNPANLMFLRPSQLAMFVEDCGLPPGGKHHELANKLVTLLVQQKQKQRGEEIQLSELKKHQRQQQTDWFDGMQVELQHSQQSMKEYVQPNQDLSSLKPSSSTEQLNTTSQTRADTQVDINTTRNTRAQIQKEWLHPTHAMQAPRVIPTEVPDSHGNRANDLRAALLRQDALVERFVTEAVKPEQVAAWLTQAHAQDVRVIAADGEDPYMSHTSRGSASCSPTSWVIVATASSQRHAYTCAEAVRTQARAALETCRSSVAPQDDSVGLRLPLPQLMGGRGMDWVAVEAGHVVAHILTERARRYYQLEELLRTP